MAISLRGTASNNAAASNNDLTVTLPGGVAQDDVVYAVLSIGVTVDINVTIVTTGYTELADLFSNDTRPTNVGVYRKVQGSTPDSTVVFNGGGNSSNGQAAVVHVLTGVDTTTPEDATSTTATGINGNVVDPPSITTVTANAWVIAAGGYSIVGAATVTAPTNYVNLAKDVSSGAVTADRGACAATREIVSPGAENPGTFGGLGGGGSDSWASISIAVRPAPPASPIIVGDLPVPRGVQRSINTQTHIDTLKLNLLGKDKFYEAGHFPTYDYPNPPQKPRSIDLLTWTSYFRIPFPPIRPQEWPVPPPLRRSLDLITHIHSLKPQLIGQDNVPIRPQEWPVPPAKPRWNGLLSWSFSVNVPPIVAPPVRAFEWPVPQPPQRSIDLRTHIDTLKLSLIGQDTFFGAPGQAPVYDWPLPPRATARSVELLSSLSFTIPPAPVASIPPGMFDWQNPPLRSYPAQLRTWVSSFVQPIVIPPGRQDTQNPPLRAYPTQLRTWISSYIHPIVLPPKGMDLSIPPFPKPRMDFIRFSYLNNTVITAATVRPPLNVVLTVPQQRLRALELLSWFSSAKPTAVTSTELVFAYISG